jgi:hypothetical protein
MTPSDVGLLKAAVKLDSVAWPKVYSLIFSARGKIFANFCPSRSSLMDWSSGSVVGKKMLLGWVTEGERILGSLAAAWCSVKGVML